MRLDPRLDLILDRMRPRVFRLVLAMACAGALVGGARPVAALPPPALDVTFGNTFGSDGSPNSGGLAFAFSPLWRAGDRARFGASVFADDIGNQTQELLNRAQGTDLGTIVSLHRMAYG